MSLLRGTTSGPFYVFLRACAREYLRDALIQNGGSVTKTANATGISRQNFHTLMRKLKIKPLQPAHRGNAQWQALGRAEKGDWRIT